MWWRRIGLNAVLMQTARHVKLQFDVVHREVLDSLSCQVTKWQRGYRWREVARLGWSTSRCVSAIGIVRTSSLTLGVINLPAGTQKSMAEV